MKDQLVDRYLQDNECNYGLYVVFWVNFQNGTSLTQGGDMFENPLRKFAKY